MQALAGAVPVGKGHDDELLDLVVEQGTELPDAFVVAAVATPHDDGVCVEPDDVASLEGPRGGDLAADRDAERIERRSDCARLVAKDGLRAVAVVHVEVDDRDALEPVRVE